MKRKNICLIAITLALYLINQFIKTRITIEPVKWFLSCYFNDTIGGIMLMCGKVTHKNLIDSSPLFRKNIISKPSRASQRQVNGLSPTVDSPVCPCWWIIKGRQQKVLPPFPIIKERERLHD